MGKKLIFFDIDGTLTMPGTFEPSEKVIEAIHKAQANGHKAFLCTGRNLALTQPFLDYGFNGTVSSAGAYVLYEGHVINDTPMTGAQRDKIYTALHNNGIFCIYETKRAAYAEAGTLRLVKGLGNSEADRLRKVSFLPFSEYDGSPVYTVPFVCPKEGDLGAAIGALGDGFTYCTYGMDKAADGRLNGEIFLAGCDKGSGIRRLCEHLSVPLEATIGFGDSMNDYAMMTTVNTSVCMANGTDELKKISDMVCPGVEEDGIAEALRELNLI